MTEVTYHIDRADLKQWELDQMALLAPLNLQMTPSFIVNNYLGHKLEAWFNTNTSDGWDEMRDSWMSITYCEFGITPTSASFEFHAKAEAMLFKLTHGGAN